jgi:hypothetical protein
LENKPTDLSLFFQIQKLKYDKCLEPSFSCANAAIRAHSVQNATAMGYISEDNHLAEIRMRIVGGRPTCRFETVGRNEASTFTGLCSHHDTSIFLPIDTKPLDLEDEEQLFLIAYRSATRELHVTIESAVRIQSAYETLVSKGRASATEPSSPGMEAIQHMLKAYSVWRYRRDHFDVDLTAGRYGNLRHSYFVIEGEKPILTSSSFFSVDSKPWGRPFAAVLLNVVPLDHSTTAVIFSYHKNHSGKVRRYIAPVIMSKGSQQKHELSLLLLQNADNFFLSPSVVKAWSDERRERIETAFASTILGERRIERSPDFMLFPD